MRARRCAKTAAYVLKIGPFMATITITLLLTFYMIFIPADWVQDLIQLTKTSYDYKVLIVVFGAAYLALAWTSENYVFQRLAKAIGKTKEATTKQTKKRKEYKLIQERMLL